MPIMELIDNRFNLTERRANVTPSFFTSGGYSELRILSATSQENEEYKTEVRGLKIQVEEMKSQNKELKEQVKERGENQKPGNLTRHWSNKSRLIIFMRSATLLHRNLYPAQKVGGR
jgi:hypothetical protein